MFRAAWLRSTANGRPHRRDVQSRPRRDRSIPEADITIDRIKLGETVKGWLPEADFHFINWFLDDQDARGVTGDLVELGVYLGKSAIVIGDHLRPGETFTVVDLFEDDAAEEHNQVENATSYSGLTQQRFESNYCAFHAALPVIHRGPSSEICSLVEDDTVRFCHVDASHLYEHVRVDVESAAKLLHEDGIVVFDDYRSPHTPGVAAAVWEAVINGGMRPLLLTSQKMYGTWSDPAPYLERLRASLDREFEVQQILGHDVIRVPKPPAPPAPSPFIVAAKAAVPPRMRPALRSLRRRARSR